MDSSYPFLFCFFLFMLICTWRDSFRFPAVTHKINVSCLTKVVLSCYWLFRIIRFLIFWLPPFNFIYSASKSHYDYCRGNSGYDFDPKCRPATAVHHHLRRRNPRFRTIQSRKPQSPNWQRSDPLSRTSPTKEMSLTLFHAPLNHRPCLWCASFNFSLF